MPADQKKVLEKNINEKKGGLLSKLSAHVNAITSPTRTSAPTHFQTDPNWLIKDMAKGKPGQNGMGAQKEI